MKQFTRKPILASTRSDLIDELEEKYNINPDVGKDLYEVIIEVLGHEPVEISTDEGFYAGLSTSQLQQVLNTLDYMYDKDSPTVATLQLTTAEVRVLHKALSDFSDPAFTKDFEMSRIASNILNRL